MPFDEFNRPVNPTAEDLAPKKIFSEENVDRMRKDEERRRGQWFSNYGPSVASIATSPGTLRKPLDTPAFGFLRAIARESLIDRAIIARRVEDIKGLSRKVFVAGKQRGWRVVHRRFDDPNFDSNTEEIDRRCREMENLIENPVRLYHKTFRDFLTVAVQEELIIDRRAMVISRNKAGKPVDYYLLPGDTILPVLYVLMPWMARKGITNERVARMMLSEEWSHKSGITIDITNAEYVQEVDGQIVGAWNKNEIDVEWTNPSGELNRWGFGTSLLEQSLAATSLLLNMFNYNKDLFRPGFPSRMLVLSGDYSAEGLSTFERQILGQGGVGNSKSKMPILPGPADMKAQVLDLTATPSDMQFEQFFRLMSSLKCAFFGMHPSRLNLSESAQQGLVVGSGNATGEIASIVNEEGLYSVLESNSDWLTRTLIRPHYEDLVLIFDGIVPEDDTTNMRNMQVEATWSTKNEIRARRNLPPLSDEDGGNAIADPIWLQVVNMKQQMAAQAQQQQGYDQGDFGQQGGAPPGQAPAGAPPGQAPAGAPPGQAPAGQAPAGQAPAGAPPAAAPPAQ
jgi:hypothetical protein